jgi:hypothetical protein
MTPIDIRERNEKGQVVNAFLSSEDARAMQAHRVTKEKAAATAAGQILAELGFSDDNPAPELIKNLADIATTRKTGAVSAIGTLLKFARGGNDGVTAAVQPGETCPHCGSFVYVSAEMARGIIDAIKKEKYKRLEAKHA